MGGYSVNELHVAASTIRQRGIDYLGGPLQKGSAKTSNQNTQQFCRQWKLESRTIDEFKQHFSDSNYHIPEEILTWPAHGDSVHGYASNLAEFVDVNNNGLYEPKVGEYPKVYGQQDVFWIFNDQKDHSETGGLPLGVEVQARAYGFVCDQIQAKAPEKALNNSVFFKFKIINRSQNTYEHFRTGFWLIPIIGNEVDDRMGTNPNQKYLFWYNGDSLDEGTYGFGKSLPAAALVFLKGNVKDVSKTVNTGSMITYQDDGSIQGGPSRAQHYYNYLSARWKDSSSMTYGGNGKGGTDSLDYYVYPGKNDLHGRTDWSMENSGIPAGFRLAMVNTEEITLQPNTELELDYAIIVTPTNSQNKDSIISALNSDVINLQGWFNQQNFPSCSKNPLGIEDKALDGQASRFKVFPNPTNDELYITDIRGEHIRELSVFGIDGRILKQTTGDNLYKMNVSEFQQGIYYLRIKTGSIEVTTKFIRE